MRAALCLAHAAGPFRLSAVLGVLVCVWACTSIVVAERLSQAQDDGWRLTLTVSGGFAGLHRELALDSSGAATAIDSRRNLQVRRQVSRDELVPIARLVESATALDMVNNVCSDCLTYVIDLRVSGRTVTIRLNDITLSSSKAAPLVQALIRMQQQLLAQR